MLLVFANKIVVTVVRITTYEIYVLGIGKWCTPFLHAASSMGRSSAAQGTRTQNTLDVLYTE